MESQAKNYSAIVIKDSFKGHSLDNFVIPSCYQDYLSSVLIPNGLILDRLDKMASEISTLTLNEPLVMICVLKGSYQFFTDLLAKIKRHSSCFKEKTHPIIVEFIRIKSYENDKSSGDVKVIGIESMDAIRGKNVLVVEDLIDTGKSMRHLDLFLKSFGPKEVKFAALMVKRQNYVTFEPQYVGFEIGDTFIVGYGMDYNEYFRDLDHICVINQAGKEKYAT